MLKVETRMYHIMDSLQGIVVPTLVASGLWLGGTRAFIATTLVEGLSYNPLSASRELRAQAKQVT